ncbi:hypothetical protein DCAR_0623929 [Daucus carota subsp. sativus]|uniref:Uncharacterized protein n=1 Tax=Daucus carota subsp. sativus TaxID=79200 RepID=A0AAF1B381_DAUCS|nr:hypothetical protein DCAR_0623929 [Daucus carota subsp. sativus]
MFRNSSTLQLLPIMKQPVETQEAVINNVANLCEAAEALCNFLEELAKQFLLNLPVWDSSPRELINSLCDE